VVVKPLKPVCPFCDPDLDTDNPMVLKMRLAAARNAANRQQDTVASLRRQLDELTKWQERAFDAHPNLDLDMKEHTK
jgi:hypothetical protein